MIVRYTHDELGRIYTDESSFAVPSTSTVLDWNINPLVTKPYEYKQWRKYSDNPDYVMKRSQKRGTFIHAYCQNMLVDDNLLTGIEEQDAKQWLKENNEWETLQDDLTWIDKKWTEICENNGITKESTINCEEFVYSESLSSGGQYDLLYQNNNKTILADIKTSSSVREKHKIQLSVYQQLVDREIDELQIIRINADNKETEVVSNTEWDMNSLHGLFQYYRDGIDIDIDEIMDEGVRESH